LLRVQLVHAVEAAQERRLAAARRADEGRHVLAEDLDVDVLQRMELAVVEIEIARLDLDHLVGRGGAALPRALGDHFGADGFHRLPPLSNMARATTLITSTPIVIRNTPAHASFCQSLNGLIANLKIVTGRFAIG